MERIGFWDRDRGGQRLLSLVFFNGALLLLLSMNGELRAADTPYLEGLLRQADEKQLHQERYWQIILHYKPTLTGSRSRIDDPHFFLAPNGRTDPKAELAATLSAFFQEAADQDTHPICRFPARFAWLKEELRIDGTRLPQVECREYQEALGNIKPKAAVLVFPSAHLNGPASMFGHTLLRIDGARNSKLVSQAVNYSAFVDSNNGLTYAFKGIFGLYPGYFTVLPYYEKVSQYNDLERRDIWEYPLNLDEAELERMIQHIWELKDIASSYYFFDENCSYRLLYLLEAARPAIHLTDQFFYWVIPLDTVRVVQESGLTSATVYRPSQASKISHLAAQLDGDLQQLALHIANQEIAPAAVTEQAAAPEKKSIALDLAAEYLQYRLVKKELGPEQYKERFWAVLSERSKRGPAATEQERIPEPTKPEDGHRSNRLTLGGGVKNHAGFQEIGYRPAYHSLLDPDEGYIEGAQLEFGNLLFRYYDPSHRLQLAKLDIINIVSLAPRDLFYQPVSWKVVTGLNQQTFGDGRDHLIFRLNPGGGFSYKLGPLGLSYALVETDFNLADQFRDNYAIGFGGSLGLLSKPLPFWKTSLYARKLYYPVGDDHQTLEVGLKQAFQLNRNNSVTVEIARTKTFGINYSEANLNWNLFW